MSRPTDDPVVWSSDANYPAGADSWNGTPTKVTPSAGVAAAGWEPEDLPPAQHLNYLLNNHGAWLEYLRAVGNAIGAANYHGPADFATNFLYGLAYDAANTRWVVGGAGKSCFSSNDEGASWTSRTLPAGWSGSATINDIIWDGANFIAVGQDSANIIGTSPTGVTWTDRSPAGTDGLFAVAYDGSSVRVAVGNNGVIFSSTDGLTWTARTAAGSYSGIFYDVAFAAGLFIAVGSGGEIQTSTDGITWTQRTADAGYAGNIYSVAEGDGLIVLVGATTIQSSTDGITWTEIAAVGKAKIHYSASYNLWVAVDTGGIVTSSDLVTWKLTQTTIDCKSLRVLGRFTEGTNRIGIPSASISAGTVLFSLHSGMVL